MLVGILMQIRSKPYQFVSLLFVALTTIWVPASPAAEASRIPGTKVSLEPPAGFSLAEQFPGFQRADAGASIVVTEVAAPVAELRAGLTSEGVASRGMTLLTSTPATISGQSATLLQVTQNASGTTFIKWMAILGDDTETIMIVGTFPQALADSMSEPIKRSILAARWNPGLKVDPFDGLPFRVTETASLKFAHRI